VITSVISLKKYDPIAKLLVFRPLVGETAATAATAAAEPFITWGLTSSHHHWPTPLFSAVTGNQIQFSLEQSNPISHNAYFFIGGCR